MDGMVIGIATPMARHTVAACWNSVTDHGWTPSQIYAVNSSHLYATVAAFPEIYDPGWKTCYGDLDSAASASGLPQPTYAGVTLGMWKSGAAPYGRVRQLHARDGSGGAG
jgi:hypothetical protein